MTNLTLSSLTSTAAACCFLEYFSFFSFTTSAVLVFNSVKSSVILSNFVAYFFSKIASIFFSLSATSSTIAFFLASRFFLTVSLITANLSNISTFFSSLKSIFLRGCLGLVCLAKSVIKSSLLILSMVLYIYT